MDSSGCGAFGPQRFGPGNSVGLRGPAAESPTKLVRRAGLGQSELFLVDGRPHSGDAAQQSSLACVGGAGLYRALVFWTDHVLSPTCVEGREVRKEGALLLFDM